MIAPEDPRGKACPAGAHTLGEMAAIVGEIGACDEMRGRRRATSRFR
jgi:hypothetical protein